MHDSRIIEVGKNNVANIYKINGGYLICYKDGSEETESVMDVRFAFLA